MTTFAFTFVNEATKKPAVYFDKPELDKFRLEITTDSATPVPVPSLRMRFPVTIFTLAEIANVTVTSPGWPPAKAAGPYVTLTPPAGTTVSAAASLAVELGGVQAAKNAATTGDVQLFVADAAPTAKLFLMRYPATADDLTRVLAAEFLPTAVYRTPSDYDTIDNVLTLRLINKDPANPLVTKSWVGTPTVTLSFVYGNGIGSLTPADPPADDPHSAFNIDVSVSATYRSGKQTFEWTATPPSGTDEPPVWTLQPTPENLAVLGAGSGATAEFRISDLSTAAPAGSTLAYLQFSDFPGYGDAVVAVPLSKEEPKSGIVYFDGVPNYVAALGDKVTLRWQTVSMARVALELGDKTVDAPLDAAKGSYAAPIDRTTDCTLHAYKRASDDAPAHSRQWRAHVPDARGTFSADRTTVAAGDPVLLSWSIQFARTAEIRTGSTTVATITADQMAAGSRRFYPRVPTKYTLHLAGEGEPADQSLDVFVLPRGWSSRRMAFSPQAGQGPVLYGAGGGLTLAGGQSDNGVFQSADGSDWQQIGVAPFPARDFAAGCAFGGKLWIMGGRLSAGRLANDVWHSDDGGSTWTVAAAAAPWAARSNFACAEFAGRLWVLGGRDQNLQPLGDVWSSADGATWTQAPAPRWSPRAGAAVAVHQGRLWLFGGQVAGGVAADLWSSADGSTWTQQAGPGPLGDGPEGRQRAALASLGADTLFLFGGTSATGAALDDLQLFEGGSWDLATGPDGWGVKDFGFAAWRGAFWFAGGERGAAASDAVWSWLPDEAAG